MANKRKGQLTVTGEWRQHLRPLWRRAFWKQERQAARELVQSEVPEPSEAPEPPETPDPSGARQTHAASQPEPLEPGAARGPGFVVLYRWRLHPGSESSFVEAWSRITALLRDPGASLGSRLHRGGDGLWYGYAQWPSADARRKAFGKSLDPDASAKMRAAIAESLPEIVLESISDYLVPPPR
jgi:hypothetical protein